MTERGGARNAAAKNDGAPKPARGGRRRAERIAALDLGTNNCRLLIAAPRGGTLRIVDSFSRIVRLGEGLSSAGALSDAAMARALDALGVCAQKMKKRGVKRQRCIATEACRAASNGAAFLKTVRERTGLKFDVISAQEEAALSVKGCAELMDPSARAVLIFDIGGGSTELSLVRPAANGGTPKVAAWMSAPIGVVSLAEKWGGREVELETFEQIVREIRGAFSRFGDGDGLKPLFSSNEAHLLGTSGTVTSIAGVHLGLDQYRRDRVDGLWMTIDDARGVAQKLRTMSNDARAAEPCVGPARADLVVSGCAILEAIAREWPASRIRVGDRGLREGVLMELMDAARRKRSRGPRRRRPTR